MRFYISDAEKHLGQPVTISGWVYNKRSSGKIKFLIVRDGTGMAQGVIVKGESPESVFEDFEKLTQESSLQVSGVLKKEPRAPGGYEFVVTGLKVFQIAEPYPISLKDHGVEFLQENRHLWIRSQKQWAALRVRSEIQFAIHEFFHNEKFLRFDAPILTPTSCEGTSTLFSTPYFDEKAYLTQSGQLYGETGAFAFGKIYTFGPTFRAEKSKTRKHLTEFWMIEPEVAFNDLDQNIELAEKFLKYVIAKTLERCSSELKILERDLKHFDFIQGAFARIHYDEAIKILNQKGLSIPWGEDLGAPHETALGEEFKKPVWITHFPAQIKAFYFKQTPDHKHALGCDLIAPDGYGEIIGGGQREENLDVLKARLQEHGLKESDYSWYLDLRRFGGAPHSGFGLGLERVVAWITGVEHVRETAPYPRMMNHLRP